RRTDRRRHRFHGADGRRHAGLVHYRQPASLRPPASPARPWRRRPNPPRARSQPCLAVQCRQRKPLLTPKETAMSDMISIQLYTLRSLGEVDVILDTVAAAGYKNVEGIGSHLDDAAVVAPKAAARGMKMTSSHVGLLALRERLDAVIDACKTFGFTDLYMPAVPPEMRQMDAAGWRAVGKELGDFTVRFAKAGIHLGY